MGHTMATFDSEQLFGSGPTRFKIGAVELRHAVQQPPGSLGVRLDSQGTQARKITQGGSLIADSSAQLQALADSIEAKLDGLPHTLVDGLGRVWSDTVMLRFDADEFVRVGARWKASYRVEYLQVFP
jgi:hypothetical protein